MSARPWSLVQVGVLSTADSTPTGAQGGQRIETGEGVTLSPDGWPRRR